MRILMFVLLCAINLFDSSFDGGYVSKRITNQNQPKI